MERANNVMTAEELKIYAFSKHEKGDKSIELTKKQIDLLPKELIISNRILGMDIIEAKSLPEKGRPSSFTQEIANKICESISTSSKSLRTICKEDDMPCVATILNWLAEGDKPDSDPIFKSFLAQYARARDNQADFLAEEMLEIAEHTEEDHTAFTGSNVVQRDKLRIDTRKWIASKLKPKKYGDKLDLNHEGGQTIIVKFQDEAE